MNTWAAFDMQESEPQQENQGTLSEWNALEKRGIVDGAREFLELVGATIFWVIIVPLSFLFEYIVLVVSVILTLNILSLFG